MKIHFSLLNLMFCTAATTALAVPLTLPKATNFYLHPHSPFPSGQTNRTELEKTIQSTEFDNSIQVSWSDKDFWLRNDQIIRDLDCTSKPVLKENILLLAENKSTAKILKQLNAGHEVELILIESYWAQIRDPISKMVGWVPAHRLQAQNEDIGVFVNIIDTFLRAKSSQGSMIITTIPKGQRIQASGYDNGWMKTKYRDINGYVDLNHVVNRADFAAWAHHDKKWHLISHRENEYLITKSKEKLALDEITAYSSVASKAIVKESLTEKDPPLRAHVLILQNQAQQWAKSFLEGHGWVWWKKDAAGLSSTSTSEITTEDLLKKNIFSMALEGKDPIQGLVSAGGVYRTTDGNKWIKINQFGDKDFPVGMQGGGYWYVGSYRSKDKGLNFEPFIRWDQMASLIETYLHRSPKHLKLMKVESVGKEEVQIQIDTGGRRLNLRSNVNSNSQWKLIL